MTSDSLLGECAPTLVAAAFPDRDTAQSAAWALQAERGLRDDVAVIGPDDAPPLGLGPPPGGRGDTALPSQPLSIIAGLALGLIAGGAIVGADGASAIAHPGWTVAWMALLGALVGGLGAAALRLRPDRGWVAARLREAWRDRCWTVVVRPPDESLARRAVGTLRRMGADPLRSF